MPKRLMKVGVSFAVYSAKPTATVWVACLSDRRKLRNMGRVGARFIGVPKTQFRTKSAITGNVEVANNTDISSLSKKDQCQLLGLPALDSGRAKRLLSRGAFTDFLAVAWIAPIPLSAAATCNEYTFELQVEPSFMASSVIRVQTRPRSARLTIDIGNKFKEALALDGAAAQVFCERLRQVLVIEQTDEPSMGLDGIQVSGKLKEANSPELHFSFWSPDRARRPRDFAIVDSVFSLLESTTPSCQIHTWSNLPFIFHLESQCGELLGLRLHYAYTEPSPLIIYTISIKLLSPSGCTSTNGHDELQRHGHVVVRELSTAAGPNSCGEMESLAAGRASIGRGGCCGH